MKLALVLWNGNVGGAEVVTATLAREWRAMGVDATVVFGMHPEPLGERLRQYDVPYTALGIAPGSRLLVSPRRFARAVGEAGPDGALVAYCEYHAAVLRLGGYRGRIVAVEHGSLLLLPRLPRAKRWFQAAARTLDARARDVDVAVSDFMLAEHRRHAHAPRTLRIHNFPDPLAYGDDPAPPPAGEELVVGCAARFVPGKGVDHAIEAVAELAGRVPIRLRIAGDGPERARLEAIVRERRAGSCVELCGFVADMPAFWSGCHLAVAPSDTFVESFCMVALEAMMAGRPVVGTRNGGIPEVVADGVTGALVEPGDPRALAAAIERYAGDRELLAAHASAAARHARETFGLRALAGAYLDEFRRPAA